MKKRKIVFGLALCVASAAAFAQTTEKTTFGIRAGVNFQNITGKDGTGKDLDNKLKTGFNFGFNAEIPVAPEFYFQPGILFSTKGAKSNKTTPSATLNLSYLEVPLNFLYKGSLGSGKILLGVGPYVALGVGGSQKNGNQTIDVKFKNKADLSVTDAIYYKPLDVGGNLLAGYEFANKLSFQLNAQLGMVNLNAYGGDAKVKNTGFGISAGYRF
jgi:hypothetical protein